MKIPQTKRYSIYKKLVLQDKRSEKLIFENKHIGLYYVYRVTDLEDNEYYYGSRISKQEDVLKDFWNYCTSSKKKELIKKYKEKRFKVKIMKVFNNPGDMIIYESFLHQYFNVKDNEVFFNKNIQNPTNPNFSGMVVTNNKEKRWVSKDTFIKLKMKGHSTGKTTYIVDGKVKVLDIKNPIIFNKGYAGVQKGKSNFWKDGHLINISIVDAEKEGLQGRNKGYTPVVNKEGVTKLLSKNSDLIKSGEFYHPTKNKVNGLNINTRTRVTISKEEFDNNPNIVGIRKNLEISFQNRTLKIRANDFLKNINNYIDYKVSIL